MKKPFVVQNSKTGEIRSFKTMQEAADFAVCKDRSGAKVMLSPGYPIRTRAAAEAFRGWANSALALAWSRP